jgi:hypothetical protein
MRIPQWFKKELKYIDASYYVRTIENGQLYEIVMNVDRELKFRDGTVYHITGPKVVDVFRYLNDAALNTLRYRKWLGRQMNIIENPQKELDYLAKQEAAAKAKEKEIANEMVAEGMYEGYRLSQQHSVS